MFFASPSSQFVTIKKMSCNCIWTDSLFSPLHGIFMWSFPVSQSPANDIVWEGVIWHTLCREVDAIAILTQIERMGTQPLPRYPNLTSNGRSKLSKISVRKVRLRTVASPLHIPSQIELQMCQNVYQLVLLLKKHNATVSVLTYLEAFRNETIHILAKLVQKKFQQQTLQHAVLLPYTVKGGVIGSRQGAFMKARSRALVVPASTII